jgi:hypothetical protein
MAFGEGVAFLADSLRAMIHEINERGHLCPEAVECVRMMFGIPLDEEENRRNRLAYWLTLQTLGCTPEESAAELTKWLEPANRPLPLRDKPIEELMGADAAACRAALSKRIQEAVDELRELQIRVRKEKDEPALLEVLQRASILKDDAARRVARCQAEVRATFHKAWRDLVTVLETDEEKGLPEFGVDDEDNDQENDEDGAASVMAEAPPEAVILDEPEPLATGVDAGPEPACRGNDEFLPFQPEEFAGQSAQLPEAVVVSIDPTAARVEGAKSAPTGGDEGTNGAQDPPSGPGSDRTPSTGQMRSAGPRSRANGCARSSTFFASAWPSTASDRPWKKLNPRARSAIEALNRDTMAEIKMRGESTRAEQPLRE